jgi:PAS domain S-box-containing protein
MSSDLDKPPSARSGERATVRSKHVVPGKTVQLNTPEEAIRLQATALETAANAVVITDRAGTILWVNPSFTALTGYTAEEVIGQNPRLFKSGQHDQTFYRMLWTTILAGSTWRGQFTNRRKDGSLYHDEHTITPVRARDGEITHFVAIMLDITARKRAEEELRQLSVELELRVRERTAQLEAANRELEAFSYSVSHDLRAPLRHIAGYVNLLNQTAGPALSKESLHCLNNIADSAQRMTRLIDDLLEFSRAARAELRCTQVDLQPLLEEAILQLHDETRGRNILWKRSPLPQVLGDQAMLRQVLINLLSNALKYTRPRDPARIEIGALETDPQETVIFVRDNGVGFDMNYAENLFGAFQRLHLQEDFEGTGIGLANVRRIIARHNGRSWAEGEPNRGATFYFSLPKA